MADRNVESVVERLYERAEVGLRKYGVTTERDDLDFEAWLQHLQDELLDGAVYIARLRTETAERATAEAAVADMRERAAKLVEYYIARSEDGWVYPTARETVYAIRALPLTEDKAEVGHQP